MPKFAKPWFRPSRSCWYITLHGKQHRLGDCTEEEAHNRAAELRKRLKRNPRPRLTSSTIPVVIDGFLHWLKSRRSPATYEWYRYRLERLANRYPDLDGSELTEEMVEDWVDEYGLSVTSRRNYFRSVKKCMKWARRRRKIRCNRVRNLEVPSAESREAYLTDDDYRKLLSLVPDPNLRDLIVTTYLSGCRPQESLRVEARHVDGVNQRWTFPKSESKGKKRMRVVYLAEEAAEITRRLTVKYPTGKLFRNSKGSPWTKYAVSCAFDRVQIRIGKKIIAAKGIAFTKEEVTAKIATLNSFKRVSKKKIAKTPAELREEAKRKLTDGLARTLAPRWSLYALRHTWSTNSLRNGVDPLTTAILMGHSDPSTLSKIYQHLALDPKHMLQQACKAAE